MSVNPIVTGLSPDEHITRLELALQSAHIGIWDWDLRDNSVHFDKRWCTMLGLDHETTPMHLSTWIERVHPDDLPRCNRDIEAYLAGKTAWYENTHRMKHANGEWIYILDRGRLSGWDADGKPIRFTGTHLDVTEREKARQLLEHQHEAFAHLIRFLPSSVVLLDTQLKFIVASERWLQSQSQNSSVDFTRASLNSFFPLSDRDWRSVAELVLKGQTLAEDRELAKRPDGTMGWYRWVCLPWTKQDGSIGGLLILSEDISETVVAEERLALESRLSAIGQMAGSLAHEINNPLAIIRANAEVLLMQGAQQKLSAQRIEKSAHSIINTTRRIERIVRALRTISHGSIHTQVTDSKLDDLITETCELCYDRFQQNDIHFETNLSQVKDLLIKIDIAQISQVILNLLNNAFDAVLPLQEKWIKIWTQKNEHDVSIFVQDSGEGIPDDVAKKMMSPFFTTKQVGSGTGLGLSLSQSYARNHKGELRYQKLDGHTTFQLRIPFDREALPTNR